MNTKNDPNGIGSQKMMMKIITKVGTQEQIIKQNEKCYAIISIPSTTKMSELIGFNSHYYQQLS